MTPKIPADTGWHRVAPDAPVAAAAPGSRDRQPCAIVRIIGASSGKRGEARGRGARTQGSETILVVEDDADVRAFVTGQLRDLGYRVIEAADGPQAQWILENDQPFDLLFTDVVMPGGMTGRQLADGARAGPPGLKAVFTSGYMETSIVHQGKLDKGVSFLSKPRSAGRTSPSRSGRRWTAKRRVAGAAGSRLIPSSVPYGFMHRHPAQRLAFHASQARCQLLDREILAQPLRQTVGEQQLLVMAPPANRHQSHLGDRQIAQGAWLPSRPPIAAPRPHVLWLLHRNNIGTIW